MAKALRFYNPRPQYFINGQVASGAQLFFYEVGTTTKKDTYTDDTKGTANPNPVILDSQGRPANSGTPIDIYLDGAYKVVLAPSTDSDPPANAVWTEASVTTMGQLETYVAKTTDYTVLETDRDKTIVVDASGGNKTITLIAAATAGNGFCLNIVRSDTSTNTVTIDGNASETINGATTTTISGSYSSISLICTGTGWVSKSITDTNILGSGTVTKTSTYTVLTTDKNKIILADATSGAITINLLAAATAGNGYHVTVIKVDSSTNAVTLDGSGSETIDGATTKVIDTQYCGREICSNGTAWYSTSIIRTAATQADMEAATAVSPSVTPAVLKFSPYAAKIWIKGGYSAGTPIITTSSGVTSLTDTSTGIATIIFTTSMSSANYVAIGSAAHSRSADGGTVVGFATPATGSIEICLEQNGDTSLANAMSDTSPWYAAIYGDM